MWTRTLRPVWWMGVVVVAMSVAGAGGCASVGQPFGGDDGSETSARASSTSSSQANRAMASRGGAGAASPRAESAGGGDSGEGSESGSDSSQASEASSDRKLVKEAMLRLRVKQRRAVNDAIQVLAKKYGGYLVQSQPEKVVIRVEAERLEEALEEIESLTGVQELVSRRIEGRDVTKTVRNYNIRLDNKREARQRYLELMREATTVSDMLKIEKELERLNTEIEEIESQLKALEERVALSKITVYLWDSSDTDDHETGRSSVWTPGLRYTALGVPGLSGSGMLHGGTLELNVLSVRNMHDPEHPSHTRLYADFSLLHDLEEGGGPAILWGGGFQVTFETTPGRQWLIPGVGLEGGQLITSNTELGHVSPTANLIVWSDKNFVASVDGSYFVPPAELDSMTGWRMDAGVQFSFW